MPSNSMRRTAVSCSTRLRAIRSSASTNSTSNSLRFAAASNALGGRIERAREMLERLRQLEPNRRISNLREVEDFPPYLARVIEEGLRKAGMPE